MKTYRYDSGLVIFNYRFEGSPSMTRLKKGLSFKNKLKTFPMTDKFINNPDKFSSDIYLPDRLIIIFRKSIRLIEK